MGPLREGEERGRRFNMPLIKTDSRINYTLYHYDNYKEAWGHVARSKYQTYVTPPGSSFITYVVHEYPYRKKEKDMGQERYSYSNYETLSVALWLDNDPVTSTRLYELANGTGEFEGDFANDYDKAVFLRDWIQQASEDEAAGLFADLLEHALEQVNYLEIIQAHKEA
jgi:hypothetical protein